MKSFSPNLIVDVRRLRVLRELQARKTIAATARALNLTPSAISQQIAALSRHIGAPLLAPNGRGVRLTAQAHLLLEHATLVDAQLERARAELAALEEGALARLSIGAFATAISGLVVPALAHVRQAYPGMQLTIEEAEAPESFTRLARGDLDVVITVDYPSGPHRGDVRYHRRELLDDVLRVALPRKHALARRKSIDLRALALERWIVGATHGPCGGAGLAACAAAGFNPDVAHRVNDWAALMRLVAAGCGIALIPRLAVETGSSDDLVVRPLSRRWQSSRHIYAAVRAGAERSPAVASMLSALGAVARKRVRRSH